MQNCRFSSYYIAHAECWKINQVLEEFVKLYDYLRGKTETTMEVLHGELCIVHEVVDGQKIRIPWQEFIDDYLPEVPPNDGFGGYYAMFASYYYLHYHTVRLEHALEGFCRLYERLSLDHAVKFDLYRDKLCIVYGDPVQRIYFDDYMNDYTGAILKIAAND